MATIKFAQFHDCYGGQVAVPIRDVLRIEQGIYTYTRKIPNPKKRQPKPKRSRGKKAAIYLGAAVVSSPFLGLWMFDPDQSTPPLLGRKSEPEPDFIKEKVRADCTLIHVRAGDPKRPVKVLKVLEPFEEVVTVINFPWAFDANPKGTNRQYGSTGPSQRTSYGRPGVRLSVEAIKELEAIEAKALAGHNGAGNKRRKPIQGE